MADIETQVDDILRTWRPLHSVFGSAMRCAPCFNGDDSFDACFKFWKTNGKQLVDGGIVFMLGERAYLANIRTLPRAILSLRESGYIDRVPFEMRPPYLGNLRQRNIDAMLHELYGEAGDPIYAASSLVSADTIAKQLWFPKTRIRRIVNLGHLTPIRMPGNTTRFSQTEVDALIEKSALFDKPDSVDTL